MKNETIYSRIIPADMNRGYVFLVSREKPVVQRTAAQVSSLSVPSRKSLNRLIAEAEATFKATVVDTTAPAVMKKLLKIFGEEPTK
ncbi:MAG: hypothetical protein AB7U63_17920 [Porticoccaceae bacterium]